MTVSEAFVRALWVVEHPLVDRAAKELVDRKTNEPDWAQILKRRLESCRVPDERAAATAVDRFLADPPALFDNLDCLSALMFEWRHGLPNLRAGPLVRRLSRLVDPDSLLCLAAPDCAVDDRLDWGAVPLRNYGEAARVLQDGSLDTHVHLGGILAPLFFWVAIVGGAFPLEALAAFPNIERRHASEDEWKSAVARAMFLRMALAAWAQELAIIRRGARAFRQLREDPKEWGIFSVRYRVPLRGTYFCQVAPDPTPFETAQIRDAVLGFSAELRLNRRRPRRWPPWDPLRSIAGSPRPHYAEGERRLLIQLGRLLRQASRPDIEEKLLKYLRIKNAFHEVLVHDYGTDGLLRFVENFARRGFIRGPKARGRARRNRRTLLDLERYRMAAALDEQLLSPFDNPLSRGRHAPVRRIEVRVSIPNGKLFLATVRAWFEGLRAHLRPRGTSSGTANSQVGLVFHLIKQGNDEQSAGRASEAAGRLGRVLEGYPELRPFVVGLDAAGDERKSPPRVFVRAYRVLQKLQAEYRAASDAPLIRLGWTYHVGEDVDDLLTGLRHLDEVASLLLGNDGGRLGHALALGEDPKRFYWLRGETEPRLGSHLLDLVWGPGGGLVMPVKPTTAFG